MLAFFWALYDRSSAKNAIYSVVFFLVSMYPAKSESYNFTLWNSMPLSKVPLRNLKIRFTTIMSLFVGFSVCLLARLTAYAKSGCILFTRYNRLPIASLYGNLFSIMFISLCLYHYF